MEIQIFLWIFLFTFLLPDACFCCALAVFDLLPCGSPLGVSFASHLTLDLNFSLTFFK